MIFWTIQNKAVLEQLQTNGIYFPDFSQSGYLAENNKLAPLYSHILHAMNTINSVSVSEQTGKGVVFCFSGFDQQNNQSLETIDQFVTFIRNNHAPIESLWKHLTSDPDNVLLQVNFDEMFFNPLLIDINDFQYLMPPVLTFPPFGENDEREIKAAIATGQYHEPTFPSNIIQAHLPYLQADDIVKYYELS